MQDTEELGTTNALIEELRLARSETVRRFAGIDPARLEDPHEWRGGQVNLRHLLASLTERSDLLRIQLLGAGRRLGRGRMTDAQHAMGLAGGVRGRLLGSLIGIPDELFDRSPGGGEWSLRQIVGHIVAVDERYRLAVEFAIDRAGRGGDGPARPAESSLPDRTGESLSHGTPQELVDRMQSVRDRATASLTSIPDNLLAVPSVWASWDVDVRFRLHRFAAHDREHLIQIRKVLKGLGVAPNEPQLLLADAQEELGALEVTLRCIGDEFLDRRNSDAEPSISELIKDLVADERRL